MKASGHRCTLRLHRDNVGSEVCVHHLRVFSQPNTVSKNVFIDLKRESRENSGWDHCLQKRCALPNSICNTLQLTFASPSSAPQTACSRSLLSISLRAHYFLTCHGQHHNLVIKVFQIMHSAESGKHLPIDRKVVTADSPFAAVSPLSSFAYFTYFGIYRHSFG